MKIHSISNDDLELLKAVKPFMSNSSREMINMTVNILKIFKPEEPGQKINLDALTSFLSVINKSFEAEKAAILDQKKEQTIDISESETIENEKNTDENVDVNDKEINKEENGDLNNAYEIDDNFARNDDNNQQSKAKDVEHLLNILSNKKDKNNTD